MCIYMYDTYIHTYSHTYIHAVKHTNIQTYIHTHESHLFGGGGGPVRRGNRTQALVQDILLPRGTAAIDSTIIHTYIHTYIHKYTYIYTYIDFMQRR